MICKKTVNYPVMSGGLHHLDILTIIIEKEILITVSSVVHMLAL